MLVFIKEILLNMSNDNIYLSKIIIFFLRNGGFFFVFKKDVNYK